VQLHQEFKQKVVANLEGHGWIMTSHEIRARVTRLTRLERRS
jgi:hypothetical protein